MNERRPPEPAGLGTMRLQRFLAHAGVASRRRSEELIVNGKVKVNNRVVTELGTSVDPQRDVVMVGSKRVTLESLVYFVMNKPEGVVCSAGGTKDERGRSTILSLLQGISERVYPAGRLDLNSRGVLLLTNDGDLVARVTHPRSRVPKTYHVKFQGKPSIGDLRALLRGVTLDDGTTTRPAKEVSVVKETRANTWVQITITQGLCRQLRRMGDAIGHSVLKLIRVAVGGVTGDGLEEGSCRPLTVEELEALRGWTSGAQQQERGRRRSNARGK